MTTPLKVIVPLHTCPVCQRQTADPGAYYLARKENKNAAPTYVTKLKKCLNCESKSHKKLEKESLDNLVKNTLA